MTVEKYLIFYIGDDLRKYTSKNGQGMVFP